MITEERLREMFDNEDKDPFVNEPDIDHGCRVISLLRDRIPRSVCKRIIQGAEHDKIYLPDIGDCLEHLNEADVLVLIDCNCMLDDDTLALFV